MTVRLFSPLFCSCCCSCFKNFFVTKEKNKSRIHVYYLFGGWWIESLALALYYNIVWLISYVFFLFVCCFFFCCCFFFFCCCCFVVFFTHVFLCSTCMMGFHTITVNWSQTHPARLCMMLGIASATPVSLYRASRPPGAGQELLWRSREVSPREQRSGVRSQPVLTARPLQWILLFSIQLNRLWYKITTNVLDIC